MSGPSKTAAETTGYQTQSDLQKRSTGAIDQVTANNGQFNGPVQDTAYYKSMLAAGTDSTNAAYDAASRNVKLASAGAGVGGSSGATQGNVAATEAQRASDLGKVQQGAISDTTDKQLTANGQQLQGAATEQSGATSALDEASQAEIARMKQGSLWSNLLMAGVGQAGSLAKAFAGGGGK